MIKANKKKFIFQIVVRLAITLTSVYFLIVDFNQYWYFILVGLLMIFAVFHSVKLSMGYIAKNKDDTLTISMLKKYNLEVNEITAIDWRYYEQKGGRGNCYINLNNDLGLIVIPSNIFGSELVEFLSVFAEENGIKQVKIEENSKIS